MKIANELDARKQMYEDEECGLPVLQDEGHEMMLMVEVNLEEEVIETQIGWYDEQIMTMRRML